MFDRPEFWTAFFTGLAFLMTFITTLIGAAVWIVSKINSSERRLTAYIDNRHKENQNTIFAMQKLVIRHETILSPEFNGSGRHVSR